MRLRVVTNFKPMVPHWYVMDADCRDATTFACAIAARAHDPAATPDHLIRAILSIHQNAGAQLLYCLKPKCESFLKSLKTTMRPSRRRALEGQTPLSPESAASIQHAHEISTSLRNSFIGPEHLMVALLKMTTFPLVAELNQHGLTHKCALSMAERLCYIPEPGPAIPRMRVLRADDFPAGVRRHRRINLLLRIYNSLGDEGMQNLIEVEEARKLNPGNTEQLVCLVVDNLLWSELPPSVSRRYRSGTVDWDRLNQT